ncbi:MAG TPA: twin-arginine translocation signal domain-containing protein [Methylomirabilota bacterium]|jgi:hypothetical protein|nr:twin-arginine translocation signal domain-containing protein [Methylomirabilota bacterium]
MDGLAGREAPHRRDVLKLGATALTAATVGGPIRLPTPAEAQTPKRGGVFRVRGEDAATGFDPHLTVNHHAWSLGHGAPNPTVPAALREWSIPIDQLSPEGRRLYEQNLPEAKRLLADAGHLRGLKVPPGRRPSAGARTMRTRSRSPCGTGSQPASRRS